MLFFLNLYPKSISLVLAIIFFTTAFTTITTTFNIFQSSCNGVNYAILIAWLLNCCIWNTITLEIMRLVLIWKARYLLQQQLFEVSLFWQWVIQQMVRRVENENSLLKFYTIMLPAFCVYRHDVSMTFLNKCDPTALQCNSVFLKYGRPTGLWKLFVTTSIQ